MINSLKPRYREYRNAWYLPKDAQAVDKQMIRYALISEIEKAYYKPIRNFVSSKTSLVIKTTFLYDYQVGDYIFLNNDMNNKYIINSRAMFTNKVNEQSLGSLKVNPNSYYVLELV